MADRPRTSGQAKEGPLRAAKGRDQLSESTPGKPFRLGFLEQTCLRGHLRGEESPSHGDSWRTKNWYEKDVAFQRTFDYRCSENTFSALRLLGVQPRFWCSDLLDI